MEHKEIKYRKCLKGKQHEWQKCRDTYYQTCFYMGERVNTSYTRYVQCIHCGLVRVEKICTKHCDQYNYGYIKFYAKNSSLVDKSHEEPDFDKEKRLDELTEKYKRELAGSY